MMRESCRRVERLRRDREPVLARCRGQGDLPVRMTYPAPATGSSDPGPEPVRPHPAVHGCRGRLRQLVRLAREVGDADAVKIEETAREFGELRRYLAPVAWAAGALVLAVRGIKLLILNWRLSLIELVPAALVWVVMWDLKDHTLRGGPFR